MAHAHLSKLNLKYFTQIVFSFYQGTAVYVFFLKKCLFLCSEYKAHKMNIFLSTQGYREGSPTI